MLSKKRYIVDIEDFIYGFKKNEKESEVMLNYRYYGNYYLKIEKNKHGKFLTIIKEKNNKREYIYNHENLYEVSTKRNKIDLKEIIEKIADESCFLSYDMENVMDNYIKNELSILSKNIMAIFKKNIKYDIKNKKFIFFEKPKFLGFFTTLIESEFNFDVNIKLENQEFIGESFEYFILTKDIIEKLLRLYKEKKEENIWLLLLEVFEQNNLSINDSRIIPINEILMKNILNFSVQNNLKLEKIDSYSEKIEDTIAKTIIEYIIKEEILSGKNKNDIDRLFIEILYKKIDKFDNVIKELLKGDFKYNHRFLPSEHEILTNIFDIYNEYLLDEVIEIIEKYKKE